MWKKILAQRTAYPKCSDTCLKYAYYFFQLSGYQFAPESHEKPQLEGRNNDFTLQMYSLKSLFFVLLELFSMWIWTLFTEPCQNDFKLYNKYSFWIRNLHWGIFFPWLFLAQLSPDTELPLSMHRAHFPPVGLPQSTMHDNHIDRWTIFIWQVLHERRTLQLRWA